MSNPPLGDNGEVRWYAIYTMSRHERRVAQDLSQRHLNSFLPTYRSVHRWKDRRKELELALFPSYVFVHAERKDRLQILQVPSVVSIVSFDGRPAVIPDAEIDALRCGLDSQMRLQPHPYLKVGKRVRIHSGPMAGQEGILIRRKDSCRVVLSIDFIMRSVSVEVDASDIEPVH
jgi:transcription antitermination factor NusG